MILFRQEDEKQETLEQLMLKQCSRANDLTRERMVIFDQVKGMQSRLLLRIQTLYYT